MNNFSQITCHTQDEAVPIGITARRLLCFGYSGRDATEVNNHIKQLEPLGIAPPEKTPVLMEVSPWLLTASKAIAVQGYFTAGEVEFVLLFPNGERDFYVGVGSDNGDIEVERLDSAMAKQMAPKVLGTELWKYAEVCDHWDDLVLRSWIKKDGKRVLYQSSPASVMLPPDDLIEIYRSRLEDNLTDVVMYSGTISCLDKLEYPTYFEAELYDPIKNRSLRLAYSLERFERTH